MKISGGASLLFLAMLILSGWGLSGAYIPSESEAFPSILYLRKTGGTGQMIRSLHYYLSSGLIVSGFVFLISFYLSGNVPSFKKEWILSVFTYLLIIGSAFTGYLLPMDQNAYWGTQVRLGIVETTPIVGTLIADILRGGSTFGSETLSRFSAIHGSVIPVFLILCAILLIQAQSKNLIEILQKPVTIVSTIIGILILYIFTYNHPAPLELPANPIDVEYVPRPEWYFLWLFEFGKYVEWAPWIRSAVLPVVGVAFLILLPFINKHSVKKRIVIAGGWCAAWLVLTGIAVYADRNLPEKQDYEKAMLIQAGENYKSLCYDCHGASGKGDGPQAKIFGLEAADFTSEKYWSKADDTKMKKAIRDGKGKDMPDFRKKLKPEQIDSIVDFIKQTYFQ